MYRLYLVLLLLSSGENFAQSDYDILYKNTSYQQFIKHPKTHFKDSITAMKYLRDLQFTAIEKGYPMASIDSIYYSSGSASVDFYLGERIDQLQVRMDPEELAFLRKNSSINEKFISAIAFTPKELAYSLKKIHNTYLNNGYPFVSMQLADHTFEEQQLKATLSIERGNFYEWTKIHVKGDSSISPRYIGNLINIKVGEPYEEKELSKITQRLNQVPFIKEIKPSELLFTKDGAELYVYVESVPISSVNGIVGFQPDPDTKRLAFTGELNLRLLDVFHRGELLDIKWQSIQKQTQSLDAQFNYPFLFNTPFGIDATFNLYKRDTSFLELGTTAGVQYFLHQGSYIKAFYQFTSSSVLSGGANNPLFSKLGNTRSNSYGLAYSTQRVDYIPNPSRGYNFLIEATTGARTSQVNDTIQPEKSTIYRSKMKFDFFIPLHRRHVIRLGSQTDFYAADEIFQNEVYRYGGLTSQRGFNEDELYATTKTTGTIEYRFLLDKNSHVFAFYDQSWYENNTTKYYNDSPYGFGVGFSFSTNFGVFSISYALGKQFDNPILLSNSKVHFGYIAYF